MESGKKVFVTIGTTKFPKLINSLTQKVVVKTLIELGYDFVQVQTGKYFPGPKIDSELDKTVINDSTIVINSRITFKYDTYFIDFDSQIAKADLIISHAGAGTCLEVLKRRKPLIVVVNEDLMNNHQTELANQLQNDGYLYYCTCETLAQTLKKDLNKLIHYPETDKYLFAKYLDKCVGFIE
ncbi:UDP-N-acetylglucosamine transferase subunit ALG13 homolog [Cylas formicarius]|uniref:UDP-N-acetylglucosamine transferase subunit ALG13 homolog n=1 Tax=Cylas formicarius TaxID=197179 RepID=UPI002958533E|nr:UDP-N-acetylglucosamine transferase subunit ALG13 homolog [Cylas formicarius]